jgi:hypothetical protein
MTKFKNHLRTVAAIAACLEVAVMIASCKKETKRDVFLLEEMTEGNWRDAFEYDNQDRLTKYIRQMTGQPEYVRTYTYNATGDLVEEKGSDYKITFSKNGNTITYIKENQYGSENGEIELNVQGFPVKWTFEGVSEEEWYKSTNTYIWQNGNNTTTESVEEWEEDGVKVSNAGTSTYRYDDKKSPFYHCKSPNWVLWWTVGYFVNNLTSETWANGITTITYEYTYNDAGFPVTRKRSNYSQTATYTYKKK